MTATLAGRITIRPARIGLVFHPNVSIIQRITSQLAHTWGGVLNPLISPLDEAFALRIARTLDLDALIPADDTPETHEVCSTPGYEWFGRDRWSPVDVEPDTFGGTLAGIEMFADKFASFSAFTATRDPADPIGDLLSVWLGPQPGVGEHNNPHIDTITLPPDLELPTTLIGKVPFVEATAFNLTNRSEPVAENAIWSMDPHSPGDLMGFWNARAAGSHVFPWDYTNPSRFEPLLLEWTRRLKIEYDARTGRTRTWGTSDGPVVLVWSTNTSEEVHSYLVSFLRDQGFSAFVTPWQPPDGWSGGPHPISTPFSRSFELNPDSTALQCSISMPELLERAPVGRNSATDFGVVAAQIEIHTHHGLDPRITYAFPWMRELSSAVGRWSINSPGAFSRTAFEGRVQSAYVFAESIEIRAQPVIDLYQQLFSSDGWKVKQTDNGRFASRLIELLGGPLNRVANQPAVRRVLDCAAKTHKGYPISKLIQIAKRNQETWPSPISSEEARTNYPASLVYWLLSRKLIRPVLELACNICSSEMILQARDIGDEVMCDLCGATTPLGLSLAVDGGKRTRWLYRLAGNVPVQKLNETMPIMATLAVLHSLNSLSPVVSPHILGLALSRGGREVEVDLAITFDATWGSSQVILGELKSYRDEITSEDVSNLHSLQAGLLEREITCFLLFATLRDELTQAEKNAIRANCASPKTGRFGNRIEPILPIVFTRAELSVTQFDDNDPSRWPARPPLNGLFDLAMESCRRNLGLSSIRYQPSGDEDAWVLTWDSANGGEHEDD